MNTAMDIESAKIITFLEECDYLFNSLFSTIKEIKVLTKEDDATLKKSVVICYVANVAEALCHYWRRHEFDLSVDYFCDLSYSLLDGHKILFISSQRKRLQLFVDAITRMAIFPVSPCMCSCYPKADELKCDHTISLSRLCKNFNDIQQVAKADSASVYIADEVVDTFDEYIQDFVLNNNIEIIVTDEKIKRPSYTINDEKKVQLREMNCISYYKYKLKNPDKDGIILYEAALLEKGEEVLAKGWDVPEGYGVCPIPGVYDGWDDPKLQKMLKKVR